MTDDGAWRRLWAAYRTNGQDLEAKRPATWFDLWALLSAHPGFQELVERTADAAILAANAPVVWRGELVSAVLLRWARRLHGTAADKWPTEAAFPTWLRAEVEADCRVALEAALRLRTRLYPEGPTGASAVPHMSYLSVREAIDGLSEPHRTILTLWADGQSLPQIAGRLQVPLSEAIGLLREAVARLRNVLGA
jgi:DNA-directed RNA polymerase specialized sigma24 family protein